MVSQSGFSEWFLRVVSPTHDEREKLFYINLYKKIVRIAVSVVNDKPIISKKPSLIKMDDEFVKECILWLSSLIEKHRTGTFKESYDICDETMEKNEWVVYYSYDTCSPNMTIIEWFKNGRPFTKHTQFIKIITLEQLPQLMKEIQRETKYNRLCKECQFYKKKLQDSYCTHCYPYIIPEGRLNCTVCKSSREGIWVMLECKHILHHSCLTEWVWYVCKVCDKKCCDFCII